MRTIKIVAAVLLSIVPPVMATALSANTDLTRSVDEEMRYFPAGAAVHIYKNGFVGIDPAGNAKPFVPGDRFVGVAYKECDNSSGAAAAKPVYTRSGDYVLTLASVGATDVGKPVFATDDATISLSGHPDAYVGRILRKYATNKATVRVRPPGERPPNGVGSIDIDVDFAQVQVANQDEGTATLKIAGSGLKTAAVGAGLTAGTTGILTDEAAAELRLLIDNDSEAENLTIMSPQVFNVTKGITFEFEGRLKTAGGAATDDVDFGLMSLSGGISATEQANMNATTSGLKSALFHIDANANDVFFTSDDDNSPVSATDTTYDNSLTVNSKYKIVVRPTGAAEVWIDGARKLSSTSFSVSTSGLFALIINIEKSTGTGVPEVRLRKLRVAGAFE